MDTKELLKRYWFLGVIAIFLIGFIGFYAVDAYKNREIIVNNKQVDGKYVAYSIDDEAVYADELYESLYANDGISKAMLAYQRAVFNEAYETTKEMKDQASIQANNILASYSADYVVSSLKAMGYENGIEDLNQYYIDSQKQELMLTDYVKQHQDEYLNGMLGTNSRLIYHILVMCETEEIKDSEGNVTAYEAKPTEEQANKLQEIQDYLASEGATFEYGAYQYSEDGSASNGGYIGLINEENANIYDQVFAKTSLALNDGEVSEPIVSQFGYHIIKNAGSDPDSLLSDYNFLNEIQNQYPELGVKALVEKADALGFVINDEEMKKQIELQIGSEE